MAEPDWKEALAQGKLLAPKLVLVPEFFEEIGIGPSKVRDVLAKLTQSGCETVGTLLAIKTELMAIELVGDNFSGAVLWNFIERQRGLRNAPAGVEATMAPVVTPLLRLLKLQSTAEGVSGFVVAETAMHKKVRLDSAEHGNSRVFSLSQNLWGDASKTRAVWLRPCYADFAKIVRRKMQQPKGDVLIAGSRGTGKSVFGLLMVLELLDDGKIVLYENKARKMMIIGPNPGAGQLDALALCCRERNHETPRDEGVYEFEPQNEGLWMRLTVSAVLTHVQDLGEDQTAKITRSGNGRKLILTSPNNTQLSQLHSEIELLKLFMPRWDLDELLQARAACFPEVGDATVKDMFETYGGIVRFVLESKPSNVAMEAKIAMNKLSIDDLASIFRTPDFINLPPQRSTGYFVHVEPTPRNEIASQKEIFGDVSVDSLVDKYGSFRCVFATETIQKDLVQRFVSDQRFSVQKFAAAVEDVSEFKAWYGYMLEAYAHKTLPLGGRKRLKTLSGHPSVSTWDVPVMDTSIPPFKSVESLSVVKLGTYLRPASKTYPTIDAFAVLEKSVFNPTGLALVLYQYTRSRTHKVSGDVIKTLLAQISSKIPPSQQSESSQSGGKSRTARKLPVVLVFGTIEDGLKTAQILLNAEGKAYSRSRDAPNVAQYALFMDDQFQELVRLCLQHE